MNDGTIKSSMRHLSMLGAWALAFGCAVGSDAFVMPWIDFLPKAGPLGTVIGILIGGLVMTVVAWNFHYMINRQPGPGGSYAYAAEAFGNDHGYICGVFLGFAYLAIICLDVTALVVVAHYTLGDVFSFGFRYTIQKSDIYLGDILFSVSTIAVATAICCRRRLSGVVQTVMAVVLAVGILVCFAAAALNHSGGLTTMYPVFAPNRGHGLFQVLNILAIAPWLFVGFESISNSSSEFRFPVGKSFRVMLAALVTSVIAYALLTAIPVLSFGDASPAGWTGAVADLANSGSEPDYHAFDVARRFLGKAGGVVIGLTLVVHEPRRQHRGGEPPGGGDGGRQCVAVVPGWEERGRRPAQRRSRRRGAGRPRGAAGAGGHRRRRGHLDPRRGGGLRLHLGCGVQDRAQGGQQAHAGDGPPRTCDFNRGHLPLRHAVHDVRHHHDRHGVLPRSDRLVSCSPRHLHLRLQS